MLPVTGDPRHGGDETTDVASHVKGRPPDEMYEDDIMETHSRRFPPASMSKLPKKLEKNFKQLGSSSTQKGKRILDSEDIYLDELQSEDDKTEDEETKDEETGKSELTFQQQQAWLVHGIWASIENVHKISSTLLVNKPQCEHIANHIKVTGDVLQKLGLDKEIVSGQVLEGSSGIQTNFTIDEMHFNHIAETFEKHFYEHESSWNWLRKFENYIGKLCIPYVSSEDFLSKKSEINEGFQDFILWKMNIKKIDKRQYGYRVQHRLHEFLYLLFEVLKHGEKLVGLEGANNEVVKRTGFSGEKFVQIHELLYELLNCYGCLKYCEGTEFGRVFLPQHDVFKAESILYYWSLNFLQENARLDIYDNFLNIEMAIKIAKLLKGPNCTLKSLSITSPGVKVDQEELHKCHLMIIAALSDNVSLTSLTVHALNGKEVHELYKSLHANKVLENLIITIDGPLLDKAAMDLSVMLKENHSLKSFTLEFDIVSLQGIVYLGAMLAEISLDEIYLRSRGFNGVYLKYLLGPSIAYIAAKCSAILFLENYHSFVKIRRFVFEGQKFRAYQLDSFTKLCVIKAFNCFSIKFTDLDPDAICRILDFLKKNKTFQVLELESWPRYGQNHGDNCKVASCLEALLAENSNLKRLHIINYLDSGMILNAKFSSNECVEVVESIARMLRTNKTLTHFSMINACLRTSDVCEIVESLKTNKALQILHLKCNVFDNPEVKVAFIDLLVNYNFTLEKIHLGSMDQDIVGVGQEIKDFMKYQLKFDAKMTLRELRSLICTTSDFPTANNTHDLKQAIETLPLQKGEGSSKEVCGSSKRAFDRHQSKVEAKDERPQILLSYSNEMRDFARLLCMKLKSSNYNVVDQDSINFAEVVDQCQLAIVVLSDMYVYSKPLMSELYTIVKSKRTNNPTLKVYPLLYKLTLQDLQNAYVSTSTLDISLEREALNFLGEEKNEVSRKAICLIKILGQGRINVGKFCEEFSELQRSSWPSNGLEFEKNAISEEGYLHAILEEIFHYMHVVKECNNDQILGHQGKLEMESKLSLRQMKPLLESIPMTNFYLHRKFNMAQFLQEKYIQYSSFEEMCLHKSRDFSLEQKDKYSKGRIAAVLFRKTFLYHFKVRMIQGPHDDNFRPMLEVATLVAEKVQKECNQKGVQTSMFLDFVDFGAPLDPKRTIAMCQNFPAKTSDGSKQLIIVQDDLTRAYYYQCVEASDLENLAIDVTIGVIGVQVISEEIHVDNIHEDGSSYSGVLEDFSYKIDFDENKQCAAKAFGDLAGGEFLSKNSSIKCSPLLVIALASAIQKKGLTLTWRNGKGHMEFYTKLAQEVEDSACQIQYTGNINQLGLEIEWGTSTSSCVPHNQTFQRGANEIVNQQVLGSNMDQSVGTSSSRDDGTTNDYFATNMEHKIALYSATAHDKTTHTYGLQTPVVGGINYSVETQSSETRRVKDEALQAFLHKDYLIDGRFHREPTLGKKYPNLESQLRNCQLHEVHDHNYLVVHDNHKSRHISIYEAIEQNGNVPKFELNWISDIPIDHGEEQIKSIFKTGLKGREMIVKRDGSNFTQLWDSPNSSHMSLPGYQEVLLKFRRRFSNNAITTSMTALVPELIDKYKSQNEWVHIIGPQEKYEASYKYWWSATSMEAIVYSRTMYTSGKLLKTSTESHGIGCIGFCRVEEGPEKLKHMRDSVESRGKFSSARGSLLSNKVMWGGLEI